MRLVLYGTLTDKSDIVHALSALPDWCYRKICVCDFSEYDGFIAELGKSPPDGIVIAMDGAKGMEGVIAARNLCKGVPILWFSDDGDFGAQSYRLGCAYFHKKPLSPEILSAAIAKCV